MRWDWVIGLEERSKGLKVVHVLPWDGHLASKNKKNKGVLPVSLDISLELCFPESGYLACCKHFYVNFFHKYLYSLRIVFIILASFSLLFPYPLCPLTFPCLLNIVPSSSSHPSAPSPCPLFPFLSSSSCFSEVNFILTL